MAKFHILQQKKLRSLQTSQPKQPHTIKAVIVVPKLIKKVHLFHQYVNLFKFLLKTYYIHQQSTLSLDGDQNNPSKKHKVTTH